MPASSSPLNQAFLLKRRIALERLEKSQQQPLLDSLQQMSGISSVAVNDKCLALCYDATQVNIRQILEVLHNLGTQPASGWWQRQRLSWYAYVDNNAHSNARNTDPHCCNKPPKGYS